MYKNMLNLYSFIPLDPNIDLLMLRAVTGTLIKKETHRDLAFDYLADLTFENEFQLNKLPTDPIIKLTKKEHLDSFFRNGTIRLGTLLEYTEYENNEINDNSEGKLILIGQNRVQTIVSEVRTGFFEYIFCCYLGEPENSILDKFEYDACYQINNPYGFALSILKSISARIYYFSKCIYKRDKVLLARSPVFDLERIFIPILLLEIGSSIQHFIKPIQYSHQNEIRFIWKMNTPVNAPLIINCPEAVRFCKKL